MSNAFEVEETAPRKKNPLKISLSVILLSDYIHIGASGARPG